MQLIRVRVEVVRAADTGGNWTGRFGDNERADGRPFVEISQRRGIPGTRSERCDPASSQTIYPAAAEGWPSGTIGVTKEKSIGAVNRILHRSCGISDVVTH